MTRRASAVGKGAGTGSRRCSETIYKSAWERQKFNAGFPLRSMATRNFTLYDLLADIIPGAVAIVFSFVFYGIPQMGSLSNSALIAGTAFFVLSYFIGRLLHSVGSIISPLLKRVNTKITEYNEHDDCIVSYFEGDMDPDYTIKGLLGKSKNLANTDEDKIPEEISVKVLRDLDRYFRRRFKADYGEKQAKKYGETLLYRDTTLYSKYEALVTFFRSILLIPVILSVEALVLCYYGYNLNTTIHDFTNWEFSAFWLVILTLPLSMYAGRKFWKARNVAFINDLHIVITQDNEK